MRLSFASKNICNICFGALCKLWIGQHIIHYIRALKASRRCSSSQQYCHHSDTYAGFRRANMGPQMMQLFFVFFLSPDSPYMSLKSLHCGWSSLQKTIADMIWWITNHFISILISLNCKSGQILLLKQGSLFQNTQDRVEWPLNGEWEFPLFRESDAVLAHVGVCVSRMYVTCCKPTCFARLYRLWSSQQPFPPPPTNKFCKGILRVIR